MYFSVGREGFPKAWPSREKTFAASERATRAQGNGTLPRNPTSGLVIIKEDQHVTAILLRQRRKFHIFKTICGQWRSIVKEQ